MEAVIAILYVISLVTSLGGTYEIGLYGADEKANWKRNHFFTSIGLVSYTVNMVLVLWYSSLIIKSPIPIHALVILSLVGVFILWGYVYTRVRMETKKPAMAPRF